MLATRLWQTRNLLNAYSISGIFRTRLRSMRRSAESASALATRVRDGDIDIEDRQRRQASGEWLPVSSTDGEEWQVVH